MRARLGESLASVNRYDQRLVEATASSLERCKSSRKRDSTDLRLRTFHMLSGHSNWTPISLCLRSTGRRLLECRRRGTWSKEYYPGLRAAGQGKSTRTVLYRAFLLLSGNAGAGEGRTVGERVGAKRIRGVGDHTIACRSFTPSWDSLTKRFVRSRKLFRLSQRVQAPRQPCGHGKRSQSVKRSPGYLLIRRGFEIWMACICESIGTISRFYRATKQQCKSD